MGRPRKEGAYLNCKLPEELIGTLNSYCRMTGIAKTKVVELALGQFLAPYKADSGSPLPATFLEGNSEYDRRVAEAEGREAEIIERPCFVLGETVMLGAPYYRIVLDGRPMKVPRESVRFD